MTWLRRGLLVLLCMLIGLIIASHWMDFRDSTPDLHTWIKRTQSPLTVGETPYQEETLRWLASKTPHPDKPWIVFLHGAPGSLSDFKSLLSNSHIHQHANLLAIDRPGYGYSAFGQATTSLAEQAKRIMHVVNAVTTQSQHLIWVGHSYGGPIAAQLAVDYPTASKGLLLLAPAIDPHNEIIFKMAYLGKWYPTRWLTPTAWRVATDEKFSHVRELGILQPRLSTVSCPTIHIHGAQDRIVPLANVDFAKAHISSALLRVQVIDEANHFLPWTHRSIIMNNIHRLLSTMATHDKH